MAKKDPDPDDVYKYLGFDVHPGKIEEFWKSEEEKKQYLEEVKARKGTFNALEREQAILNVKLMTPADKIISTIGSVLLIISFVLPVYSFAVHGKNVSGSAISYFLNLPLIGSYASWGGGAMMLAAFVFALILIACPVAGVLNLIGLYNKKTGEDYFTTVKQYSRYNYVPVILYVFLLVVLVFGGPQPFGSLGVDALGDSLNITAVFKMTGIGFWLNIAGLAIGYAQSRGL